VPDKPSEKPKGWCRTIWTDPVWSKVIATGICGSAGLAWLYWPSVKPLLEALELWLLSGVEMPTWFAILQPLLIVVAIVAGRRAKAKVVRRLREEQLAKSDRWKHFGETLEISSKNLQAIASASKHSPVKPQSQPVPAPQKRQEPAKAQEDLRIEHTGMIWRWKHSPKRGVVEISPFCPVCDFELKPYSYGTRSERTAYNCPRCNQKRGDYLGHSFELVDLVKREIERRERLEERKA
jgi:hypothetical protein